MNRTKRLALLLFATLFLTTIKLVFNQSTLPPVNNSTLLPELFLASEPKSSFSPLTTSNPTSVPFALRPPTTASAPLPSSLPVTNSFTVLRHLQIVFRHGDRAPLAPLFENDPFRGPDYWPNGLDQLTNTGRQRMFRLGQMIRTKYGDYLRDEYSPREVYARSSAIDRCLESAQLVLAGAYPPKNPTWQWDINDSPLPLARLWQSIPIASFLPPDDDSLLRTKRACPNADKQNEAIFHSDSMLELIRENAALLDEVSQVAGQTVDDIEEADRFHEILAIEHENHYYWSNATLSIAARLPASVNWTVEHEIDVLHRLETFSYARWNNEWDSPLIKRVRAGELLAEIEANFHQKKSILDFVNSDQNKLILYSTHDTKLAALLVALDVWNRILVPYSTAIMFELHQSNRDEFFVAIRYYNETMSLLDDTQSFDFKDSHTLDLPACRSQAVRFDGTVMCPLSRFSEIVSELKFDDWNEVCGMKEPLSRYTLVWINISMLICNLGLLLVLLLLIMYFYTKTNARRGYKALE